MIITKATDHPNGSHIWNNWKWNGLWVIGDEVKSVRTIHTFPYSIKNIKPKFQVDNLKNEGGMTIYMSQHFIIFDNFLFLFYFSLIFIQKQCITARIYKQINCLTFWPHDFRWPGFFSGFHSENDVLGSIFFLLTKNWHINTYLWAKY